MNSPAHSANGEPDPETIPITLAKPTARKARNNKAAPFDDDEAAGQVVKVARTGRAPTRATFERFDSLWGEACHQATSSGMEGIAHFLRWLKEREEHADRYGPIHDAIEKAEDKPIDDDADATDDDIRRTDLGNARRLVKFYGNRIRFHTAWKVWFIWDGRRWREDPNGQIVRLAKKTVGSIYAEARRDQSNEREAIAKWGVTSESRSRIDAMVDLARSEPGIPVQPDELDVDPMLFNVLNGTIDLRTGDLRPHQRSDLITKLAPVRYDPEAMAPRWDGFLRRIMADDPEMIAFLRRAAGYGITGDTSEQCLFFFFGGGSNGKSTFLDAVERTAGDYAITVDPKILMSTDQEQHPTELCDLDGPRFVNTVEVEDGKKMAESLVKRLTGGMDKIRARRIRKDPYQFEPRFKIFLAANSKPVIRGTDQGIWRRIRLVPFGVEIPDSEKIKNFDKLLATERPGILAWLVRGCLEWQQGGGLRPPDAVTEATAEYRREMDGIQKYLDQNCLMRIGDPSYETKFPILYRDYKGWCDQNGVFILSGKKFGTELTKKGIGTRESNGTTFRVGLGLIDRDKFEPNL